MESDDDYMGNNRAAVIWFLDNRDKIAAALKGKSAPPLIPTKLILEMFHTLGRNGCKFFACDGPDKRPVSMKTCVNCWTYRTAHRALTKAGLITEELKQ
jgi:hypothetical protein